MIDENSTAGPDQGLFKGKKLVENKRDIFLVKKFLNISYLFSSSKRIIFSQRKNIAFTFFVFRAILTFLDMDPAPDTTDG